MGDDDFWDETNPSYLSIDIANSKKIMTGSHITEQHTHEYQQPVPPELLYVTLNKLQAYDSPQNYQLNSPNKFKKLNILLKMDNVTNNVSNTQATDV